MSVAAAVAADRDDVDLLRRHRALGEDAVVPARRRDRHAGALRRHRPLEGLCGRLSRLGEPEPELAQPVRRVGDRHDGRSAHGDLHLLGLGHRGRRERGDDGRDANAGHRRRRQHAAPARHLHRRELRGDRRSRASVPRRQRRRGVESARAGRDALWARQALDHRDPHLRVGVDADDDPARDPRGPFDERARRRSQAVRVDPPDPSHARIRHDRLRRDLGRLLRRLDDGERQHPQRLDHRHRA